MFYSPSSYLQLPSKPGVYRFLDDDKTVLYVGKAKDLKARVSSYFTNHGLLEPKTAELVKRIKKIQIVEVESELESLLLEAFYIKKYKPKYNIRLVDNKTYPLIKISINDTYPSVMMTRRTDDRNALYFGPYPSSSSVQMVLRTIRRAFPFISSPNHPKRICLYNHLGLCPCLPVSDTPENRKAYKHNLKQIIRILEGESKKIMRELEKEREKLSKAEHFEEAQLVQKQINALGYITQPFYRPFEYDLNPNLREDLRTRELEDLRSILNSAGYQLEHLRKIECYDISHIQGSNTTASMVVFVNGEKESALYRKFKIRLEKTPDDFKSMQEVLERRLKHTEWEYPDLIIVDGGKGQVSAALELFNEKGITIPLIGLAKREEIIVVPLHHPQIIARHSEPFVQDNSIIEDLVISSETRNLKRSLTYVRDDMKYGTSVSRALLKEKEVNFQEINLPNSTKAVQLLQRIRDEAHRFAITYHRKLRSKSALASLGIS